MAKYRLFMLMGIIFFLGLLGFPETVELGLLNKEYSDKILNEISGERTINYVRRLARFDRVTASREYDLAAKSVLETLKGLGIKESFIEAFPFHWSQDYYMEEKPGWWPIKGWSVKRAILNVVKPRKKIADYDEEPISLARMSRSFKGRAELVYVGQVQKNKDYGDLDVSGKIVLTRGAPSAAYKTAVLEKDAIGVISFGTTSYNRLKGLDYPQMIVWQVLSPIENDEKKPQFAFSISEDQGQYLLGLLASQDKVELDIDIESEFYDNETKIVQAKIPGREKHEEEFLFYAHLDHVKPSAGDNASGCALLIEIADTLNRLISQRQIPHPKRTIRFVWGPEGPGSLMYINAHKNRLNKTWAGLNLDMVGFDREKTRTVFCISRTPDSLPSFFPDLVQNLIENLDTKLVKAQTGKRTFLNYRFVPFSASSDHYYFNDGAVRVPMMMFNYSPDEFHHTNLDTPETLDSSEMKKNGFLAASCAYFVASADSEDALNLAHSVASNGQARIHQSAVKGQALLRGNRRGDYASSFEAGRGYILAAAARESHAILSATNLCDDKHIHMQIKTLAENFGLSTELVLAQLDSLYRHYCRLHKLKPEKVELTAAEKKAEKIVPKRIGRFLNSNWQFELSHRGLEREDKEFIDGFKVRLKDYYIRIPEILNFIDGQRNLLAIRNAVAFEYFGFQTGNSYAGHSEDIAPEYRDVRIEDLCTFMDILKKVKMIDFEKPNTQIH